MTGSASSLAERRRALGGRAEYSSLQETRTRHLRPQSGRRVTGEPVMKGTSEGDGSGTSGSDGCGSGSSGRKERGRPRVSCVCPALGEVSALLKGSHWHLKLLTATLPLTLAALPP